jgi:hypothetical protein
VPTLTTISTTCTCPRCGGHGYLSLADIGDDIHALRRKRDALVSELKSLQQLIAIIEIDTQFRNRTYFISDGDAVKIGYSTDPGKRLRALQTAHPKRLTLLGVCSFKESELHEKFHGLRLHGEWFKLTPELEQFIQESTRSCEWKAGPLSSS